MEIFDCPESLSSNGVLLSVDLEGSISLSIWLEIEAVQVEKYGYEVAYIQDMIQPP